MVQTSDGVGAILSDHELTWCRPVMVSVLYSVIANLVQTSYGVSAILCDPELTWCRPVMVSAPYSMITS